MFKDFTLLKETFLVKLHQFTGLLRCSRLESSRIPLKDLIPPLFPIYFVHFLTLWFIMLFWDVYLVWIMINQTVDIQVSQALQSFILVFGSINPGLLTLFLIHIRVNGKVQPYSLGLFGFYTIKFEKLDFTLWSLVQLAKSHPRLIWQLSDTSSCWHVFFFLPN